MTTWKSFAAGFLLGVAVCGGAGAWYLHQHGRFGDGGGREAKLLKEFTRELDLTDEQRKSVGSILQAQREKIQEIRGEIRPRMEEIREQAGAQIRELLQPDQLSRYNLLEARMKEERRKKDKSR